VVRMYDMKEEHGSMVRNLARLPHMKRACSLVVCLECLASHGHVAA